MIEKGCNLKVRNYRQNCALARASDLLGERWTMLIVRDLLVSPRRFSELEKRLKGMGANLLTRRLKDMAVAGLVETGEAREPYRLTEKGRSLEPMVLEMINWSLRWARSPADPDGLHFPDWDLLALKALFVPNDDLKSPVLAQFRHEDWSAWVRVTSDNYSSGLGEPVANGDVLFPCSISHLRHSSIVLEKLPENQLEAAACFMSAFSLK
ncbi:MAG: helix-turn-helix domain-containing protein [Erythrobacter sp.]|uniref:winged helix-turn-helix transcriptional regulator n=1 Tax=Erythrobacter sp. TaxID=1042 RepID=UPI0032676ED9